MRPGFERDEEPVVPRRVVPYVSAQEQLDKRQFTAPEFGLVEVDKQPLAVCPRVVILLVDGENLCDKRKFGQRLAELCLQQPTVVPYLIILDELL